MNVSQRGEFGLIAHLHQSLGARPGTRLGIGDDGALLESLAHPVVTADALVESVHFRRDWSSAFSLGIKAMAVNLSDLAAMGARPVAAFVTLALPPDCELSWVEEFYRGLESLAARHQFTIAGGDTTAAPLTLISLTLIGDLMPEASGEAVMRDGARVGDALCVTGTLGDSAAGLELLRHPRADFERADYLIGRHLEPTPRLEAMRSLLGAERESVHAALDLSDGLAGDAAHIARASGVTLEIQAERLPLSDACRALAEALGQSPLDWALSGGEDYELCLCVAPQSVARLQAASEVPLTVVGRVVADAGEVRVLQDGKAREVGAAWTHF